MGRGGFKKGGGATKREGGACEVLPLRKEGAEKFSHAEGGWPQKAFWVVSTW